MSRWTYTPMQMNEEQFKAMVRLLHWWKARKVTLIPIHGATHRVSGRLCGKPTETDHLVLRRGLRGLKKDYFWNSRTKKWQGQMGNHRGSGQWR